MELKLFVVMCAALITFLFVVTVHYLPWQLILGKRLPRHTAYVLGVLSIVVPYSASILMFEAWSGKEITRFLWILCAVAGLAVVLCKMLDKYLDNRARADEGEEREERMLKRVQR